MYFSKMHGLNNDFIIIDAITQNIHLTPENIKYLSNRYYGIGCNQLLIIEPPYDPEIDFHCRIYNSNGIEVNQCGNGIRCLAQFVYIKKITNKRNIRISTRTNHISLSLTNNNCVSANMGEPIFDPKLIPFSTSESQKNIYILFLPTQTLLCSVVSMGNPHCIIPVESVNTVPINTIGPIIEHHHYFPEKTNIGFMEIITSNNIKLRVHERDVGETQACGSAACAAVAIGIKQKLLDKTVTVNLPGGTLSISWEGVGHPLYMTGPTTYIYEGCINL